MKTFQKVLAVTFLSIFALSCSKDDPAPTPVAYDCVTCHNTPDALAANDASAKGIYKGVMVGSTGTISINIQNGSSTITATMVIDGVSIALTSNVTVIDGESYVAPFTGTYQGNPVTITFAVGYSGGQPTMVSSNIPGHPDAVFTLYKETSTSLIEAFQGTYSKIGETGVFNVVVSRGLGLWGGVAKANGDDSIDTIEGTVNAANQIVADNETVMATISGDVLNGSFQDGNGATITLTGQRTL